MCIKWTMDKINRMKKLPSRVLMTWGAAKGLAGLGIGILLASYFPDALSTEQWIQAGWVVLVIAVLLSLIVFKEVFRKRTLLEKIIGR